MARTGSLTRPDASFARYGGIANDFVSDLEEENVFGVGTQEVSWTSRTGESYGALVFYPTIPPSSGKKFSVVIYSHGLGSSAENFSYLGYSWASMGIVVVCLRHPGSDESIWRGKLRAMNELRAAYQKYWTSRDRATAISSAIDFLETTHNDTGPLGKDLDLSCIAVAGNDLGALAALLVAGQLPPDNGVSLKDSRVAAVLALSPSVFCDQARGKLVYSGIEVPVMVVTGTEDDGIVGITKAFQRRIPYDSIEGVDCFLVTLQGGDHRVYAGHKLAQKQAADVPFQDTIRDASDIFLLAYLNKDPISYGKITGQGSSSCFSNASLERRVFVSKKRD